MVVAMRYSAFCNSVQSCNIEGILPLNSARTAEYPSNMTVTKRLSAVLFYRYLYINVELPHVFTQSTYYTSRLQTQTMSLLHAVEEYLGPIDTWPAYIIEYLVVNSPTAEVIKELTAFFFGNGVPESLAYRLYNTCNPTTSTVASVRDLFYVRYFLWQKGKYLLRMAKYYDMTLKKFVYLSGSYYTQFDPIGSHEPVIGWPDPAIGIDNTSCPNMIRSMLQHVQMEQV